ncbi:class III chitinase ChiA2 [Penicillium cosmopolitanum]|uniref:Class III chitinase ChiA2 n=1 Tax=Penicillium cosmopolitanum TaxID=1131564 RepID=A0A9W9W9X9_9EURO|nr:class III chitinase ChiA2 [Penicillium cosmopolitanum]KAJ5409023.1 class III chitinase ChiA2 [Penicillium cosmopolitanum]
MTCLAFLLHLLLALGVTTAFPQQPRDWANGAQNVAYWGQDGHVRDLINYCNTSSGIDIIILSFLYRFGNGNTIPSGELGSHGIKVIVSLGGSIGAYSLSSQAEAEAIGQHLWEAYGNTRGSVPRPFGATFVNGWDFDVEATGISLPGAPQCPIPEPYMETIIQNSEFDYLWVQHYNNPYCSNDGNINFDAWVANIAGTRSANAKIFIGVPASPLASTGTASGAQYYMEPHTLASVVGQHKDNHAFGGLMTWSAGWSDTNVNNGCTYAQEMKRILTTGSPC